MTAFRSNEEWRGILDTAAAVVDRWWKDAGVFSFSEDVDRRATIAEGLLKRAYALLDSTSPGEARDASLRAYVDGALAQVDAPPLRWTDPLRDTATEVASGVKDAAKTAGTWGAAGAGFALVVVALLYIAAKVSK